MKKTVALLLVLALALVPVVALVGCSGDSGSGTGTTAGTTKAGTTAATTAAPTEPAWGVGNTPLPIADPPIDIQIALSMHQSDVYDPALPKFQYLFDITGITIDLIAFIGDTATEQKNVLLASGDLPDMMSVSSAEANLYGYEDKYFMPVDDLFDLMPNYFSKVPLDSMIYLRCAQDDLMYGIPRTYGLDDSLEYSQDYREDLLADLGIEQPANLDELWDALITARDKYVPSNNLFVPLIMGWGWAGDHPAVPAIFEIVYIYGKYGRTWTTLDDNVMKYIPVTEERKFQYEYMGNLYKEKLIAQNYMSIQYDEWWDNGMCAGNGFSAWGPNFSRCNSANTTGQNAGLTLNWQSGYFLENQHGVRAAMHLGSLCTDFLYAFNAETEYAEEMARLNDYMYTKEGWLLWDYGFEGDQYALDDTGEPMKLDIRADSKTFGTPIMEIQDKADKTAAYQAWMESSGHGGALGTWFNFMCDRTTNFAIRPDDRGYPIDTHFSRNLQYLVRIPKIGTTQDGLIELQGITPDLYTAADVARDEFVTGKRSLDEWDAYTAEQQALGYERGLEITQSWLDRYFELAG